MIKVGTMSMIDKEQTWARVLVIMMNKLNLKEFEITDEDIQNCVNANPSFFCEQATPERFLMKLLTPEEAKSTMEKYDIV